MDHIINVFFSSCKKKFNFYKTNNVSCFIILSLFSKASDKKTFFPTKRHSLSFVSNNPLHISSISWAINTYKNFVGKSFVISSKSVALLGAWKITAFYPSVNTSTKSLIKQLYFRTYVSGLFVSINENTNVFTFTCVDKNVNENTKSTLTGTTIIFLDCWFLWDVVVLVLGFLMVIVSAIVSGNFSTQNQTKCLLASKTNQKTIWFAGCFSRLSVKVHVQYFFLISMFIIREKLRFFISKGKIFDQSTAKINFNSCVHILTHQTYYSNDLENYFSQNLIFNETYFFSFILCHKSCVRH